MADLSRVKDVTEIAAASPDQRVRDMAIRYKQTFADLQLLDSFFDVYSKGVAQVQPKVTPKTPVAPISGDRKDLFGACMTAILQRAQHPLTASEMLSKYCDESPADAPYRDREGMRVALAKRKSIFGRTADKKYCLAGVSELVV